jgi:hypothetical protein
LKRCGATPVARVATLVDNPANDSAGDAAGTAEPKPEPNASSRLRWKCPAVATAPAVRLPDVDRGRPRAAGRRRPERASRNAETVTSQAGAGTSVNSTTLHLSNSRPRGLTRVQHWLPRNDSRFVVTRPNCQRPQACNDTRNRRTYYRKARPPYNKSSSLRNLSPQDLPQ